MRFATRWTCDRCGVAVGRIDGERVPLPPAWSRGTDGTFCLSCRRDLVAQAALDSIPADSSLELRASRRRAALVEFEVRRHPDHNDGAIAKACRSSVSAVAAARRRLELPGPSRTPRRS